MNHLAFLSLAALSVSIFGGCVEPQAQTATSAAQPELISEEGMGAVEGTAYDASLSPLEGVQVGIIELARTTSTDASGYFSLPNVPPGRYQLAAQKIGYASAGRFVEVISGETATEKLELSLIPIVEPYSVVQIQRGNFGCGFAYRPNVGGIVGASICGAVSVYANISSVDQFLLFWDLAGPYEEWQGNAYEMEWQSTQVLGGGLWARWETNNCWGSLESQWASVRGKSPLREVYGAALLAEKKDNNTGSSCASASDCGPEACKLGSRVFPHTETLGSSAPADVGVAFQQPFTQYWTQFYNEEPPIEYSAMPDS